MADDARTWPMAEAVTLTLPRSRALGMLRALEDLARDIEGQASVLDRAVADVESNREFADVVTRAEAREALTKLRAACRGLDVPRDVEALRAELHAALYCTAGAAVALTAGELDEIEARALASEARPLGLTVGDALYIDVAGGDDGDLVATMADDDDAHAATALAWVHARADVLRLVAALRAGSAAPVPLLDLWVNGEGR